MWRPEQRGVGDVVINKLTPLHYMVSVQLGGGVNIRDHVDTDQPG